MPKIRCLITMGDPSGIGPEIIVKALNSKRIKGLADFSIIGDAWVFGRNQKSRISRKSGIPPNVNQGAGKKCAKEEF